MSRGLLTDEELAIIGEKLPDLSSLRDRVLALGPGFILSVFPPESDTPVAAVCLNDAFGTLEDVVYALHEHYAHGVFYREHRSSPVEMEALHFERYYIDDAALRLYSAAEHLANAIVLMLNLDEEKLRELREKRSSRQAAVGRYLARELPEHTLSRSVGVLARSSHWRSAMKYRNEWVHDQPPTVENLGIVYHRKRRWKNIEGGRGKRVALGGGDAPRYTVGQIHEFVKAATLDFVTALDACVDYYLDLLSQRGFSVSSEKGKAKMTLMVRTNGHGPAT